MSYEANATTGANGKQIGADGFDFCTLRAEPLCQEAKNPWEIEVPDENWRQGVVGDLLSDEFGKYHLLGAYLTNDLGILATTKCEYGKSGIWRVVRVGSSKYMSDSMHVYTRREYQRKAGS